MEEKIAFAREKHTVAELNLTLFISLVLRDEWKHIYNTHTCASVRIAFRWREKSNQLRAEHDESKGVNIVGTMHDRTEWMRVHGKNSEVY